MEKGQSFQKWFLNNWTSICKTLHISQIIDLYIKHESIKLLEDNMGEIKISLVIEYWVW